MALPFARSNSSSSSGHAPSNLNPTRQDWGYTLHRSWSATTRSTWVEVNDGGLRNLTFYSTCVWKCGPRDR